MCVCVCTNVNPHPTGETGLLSGPAKLRLAATARCPQCRIKNGHGCDGLRMHLVRSRSWLNCNRDGDGMRTGEKRGGGEEGQGVDVVAAAEATCCALLWLIMLPVAERESERERERGSLPRLQWRKDDELVSQ